MIEGWESGGTESRNTSSWDVHILRVVYQVPGAYFPFQCALPAPVLSHSAIGLISACTLLIPLWGEVGLPGHGAHTAFLLWVFWGRVTLSPIAVTWF